MKPARPQAPAGAGARISPIGESKRGRRAAAPGQGCKSGFETSKDARRHSTASEECETAATFTEESKIPFIAVLAALKLPCFT